MPFINSEVCLTAGKLQRECAVDDNIYLNGGYFLNNPTWDVEDSLWKAMHVRSAIDRLGLCPKRVVEVGCGAGEILNQLYEILPKGVEYSGFEISPKALELCQVRRKGRLNFYLGSIPEGTYFDLLLALDVFEHVEDYFGFLKGIRGKAEVKIFHIPLDMSVRSVAAVSPISHAHNSVGHLHYFSKETALSTLTDCGYAIVDWFYTSGPCNRPPRLMPSAIAALTVEPLKRTLFRGFEDQWVRLFGGSMLVVAK